MHTIIKFLKDENAATAIEYGLIATGIAMAIISVITDRHPSQDHLLHDLNGAQIGRLSEATLILGNGLGLVAELFVTVRLPLQKRGEAHHPQ